jgi:hypothetical protein
LSRDIFEFWAEMPEGKYEHPADLSVLERMEHSFSRDCVAGPYNGRLRTAPVVLLFLSPGLDESDPAHSASVLGCRYYAEKQTGNHDLPTETEHPSAYRWLNRIIKQFGVSYEQARSNIATLNIGAYKSKTFDDWAMLAALPSSRVCLDWAQSVLFPQAEAGERTVVCLRSPKYWGLRVGTSNGSLFCPEYVRSGDMRHGEMREAVVAAVQRAVMRSSNSI